MGRKPNPLIIEFFERGPKLEDASNRYQHTCKACGEVFPKGRIDSLTNHIVKKCSVISTANKQRALLQLHELPITIDSAETANATQSNGNALAYLLAERSKPANSTTSGSPLEGRTPWVGLDALAEASRRVNASASGQNKSQPSVDGKSNDGANLGKTVIVDPFLETMGNQMRTDASDDNVFSSAPALPSFPYYHQGNESPSTSPQLPSLALASTSAANGPEHSQLSMIAASANEMMPRGAYPIEPDIAAQSTEMSTRLFDGQGTLGPKSSSTWPMQAPSPENMFFDHPSPEESLSADIMSPTQRAATYPRPIAMNPNSASPQPSANSHGPSKPLKPKVRGRFDPTRRKEVQAVRKQGACIRCRMLKKPCSGETPCNTCKNVESPRTWKHACIRTRLSDNFEAWGAGLHSALAWQLVNNIKTELNLQPGAGRIDITHFLDPCVFITFSQLVAEREFGRDNTIRVLDTEKDDLPGKVAMYITRMAPAFYENESSSVMKSTLRLAAELCANKMDTLLGRVLELWVATHILVDKEIPWLAYLNTSIEPVPGVVTQPDPVTTLSPYSNNADQEALRVPIDYGSAEGTNAESYGTFCAQLDGATEKRWAKLSKIVMIDLERRLLQRQQSDWFDTFLVSLILLNCIERTCWLFMTWEEVQDISKWPLDRRPLEYAAQGEKFSDVLYMQLKMRGLPPKTSPDPETSCLTPTDRSHINAIRWFEDVHLTHEELFNRANAQYAPQDSRSLDLKYGSKLLLPTVSFD